MVCSWAWDIYKIINYTSRGPLLEFFESRDNRFASGVLYRQAGGMACMMVVVVVEVKGSCLYLLSETLFFFFGRRLLCTISPLSIHKRAA